MCFKWVDKLQLRCFARPASKSQVWPNERQGNYTQTNPNGNEREP